MSLKVNKDNIFFMEEDFVLHATAKVNPDTLKDTQAWIIARNGMHSGINAI